MESKKKKENMICMIWIILDGRKIGRYIRRQKGIRLKKRIK